VNKTVIRKLQKLNACQSALDWLAQQQTVEQAWRDCKDPQWMLWLLGRLSGKPGSAKRRKLVLCACDCAATAPNMPAVGKRALRVARAYARRKPGVTLEMVTDAAAYAAVAAARAAAANAAAANAAYAAVSAAAAYAYAAARAARAASYAAYAAASYAAYAAAREKTLARCANIVRKHYPTPPRLP
jgi:hypothetical protein